MTLTSISNIHSVRFTRRLAAVLVAVGATACTVDKDLTTVSDSDTEVSAASTVNEPSTSTSDGTSAGDTSSGTTDYHSSDNYNPTSSGTTDASTTDASTTDNSTTDGSTTDEPALGCPDHPTVDDCCCFEKDGIYVTNVCTAEQEVLCDDVALQCLDGGGSDPDGECVSATDEALVDCALSALMGDKAGSIRVNLGSQDNPGYWKRRIDYHIVGDGSVYRVDDTLHDLSGQYKNTGLFDLQPPDFFTACLAGSIAEKADCLREALSGNHKEVCVAGFSYDDF